MHLFLLTVDSDLFWFSTGASLFCFACEWIYIQAYRGWPDTVETRPSSEECKQKAWTDESSAVVLSPCGRYKPNCNWYHCFKISTNWMLPGCTRLTPSIYMFNDAELIQADRILWSADLSHDPLFWLGQVFNLLPFFTWSLLIAPCCCAGCILPMLLCHPPSWLFCCSELRSSIPPPPQHLHGLCFFNPCWWGFDIHSMLCLCKLLSGNKNIESEPDAKSASVLVKWYPANVANDCEQ